MKERPIIFTGESVRAIIAGRKTMTRRVIRDEWWRCLDPDDEEDLATAVLRCPFGVSGDQLWVRESCRIWLSDMMGRDAVVEYRADGTTSEPHKGGCIAGPGFHADLSHELTDFANKSDCWKSPRAMPRCASRLLLTVTEVRVERLQQITEADARAEGVEYTLSHVWKGTPYRDAFHCAWDAINGKRALWSENCWVWVVTFTRVQ